MATKLYFHNAANALSGSFPTGEQSALTETGGANYVAIPSVNTLRTMNGTIGASQVSKVFTSHNVTTQQKVFLGYWCSNTLDVNQTVGGGQINITIARSQSNTNMVILVNYCNIYVWRPSTNAIIGVIKDTTVDSAVTTPAATTEYSSFVGFASTSAVSALAGDVIIFEFWAVFTQGMATSYQGTIYFDGTTEQTVSNTIVTNHAGYVQFTENLTFGTPSSRTPRPTSIGHPFII